MLKTIQKITYRKVLRDTKHFNEKKKVKIDFNKLSY